MNHQKRSFIISIVALIAAIFGILLGYYKFIGLLIIPLIYFIKFAYKKLLWKVRNRFILILFLLGFIPFFMWLVIFFVVYAMNINTISGIMISNSFSKIKYDLKTQTDRILTHYLMTSSIVEFKDFKYIVIKNDKILYKNIHLDDKDIKTIIKNYDEKNKFTFLYENDNIYFIYIENMKLNLHNSIYVISFFDLNDKYVTEYYDKTQIYITKLFLGRLDTFKTNSDVNIEIDYNQKMVKINNKNFNIKKNYSDKTETLNDKNIKLNYFWFIDKLRNSIDNKNYILVVSYYFPIFNFLSNSYIVNLWPQFRLYIYISLIVLILLIIIEIIGFAFTVLIMHRIVKALNFLQMGTQEVMRGNFSYKINVFKNDELGKLASSFNFMTMHLQKLFKLEKEKREMEKEIEIATKVQQTLFMHEFPKYSKCDISAKCFPAKGVAGDYYDIIPIDEDIFDFLICDVSGKGLSASLLMSNLQSAIRSVLKTQENISVKRMVRFLNTHLYENSSPTTYATLFYGRINLNTMKLIYCNAGHNSPFLFRDNEIKELAIGGTVIGMFPNVEYEEENIDLMEKDLLVLYTDGITEAWDKEENQFGEERLILTIKKIANKTAENILDSVNKTVDTFSDGMYQSDDKTIMIIKLK